MTATIKPYKRRQLLEAYFASRRWAQGNQAHDASTNNGAEACTHVSWCQAVIELFTGQKVTIDEVSRVAGYKRGSGGMNSSHVDRVIKHWKLPYVATWRTRNPRTGNIGDWSANDLSKIAREVGPVMVVVGYGLYPLSRKLSGGPNGNARQGGRNDLYFAGLHAVLEFAARWLKKQKTYDPRFLDPDHGFPSHPRVPRFDIISQDQFARMWRTNLPGRPYGQIGYIPTEPWNGLPDGAAPV
jgi:hypothetical protein